ncbi:MAG: helix-turn-helix domain-containing protein [Pirellulaceae bacterium]|nr:sigma-54-dependent Fis family transcriptional regulator [Planctomycetales bacterium]
MARRRSASTALTEVMQSCVSALYVLDEGRYIAYANDALCRWLEMTLDEIVGLRTDYHSLSTTGEAARIAGLCPPLDVFSGKACTARIFRSGPSGMEFRTAQFVPLGRDAATCSGVIAIVQGESSETDEHSVLAASADADWHVELAKVKAEFHRQWDLDQWIGKSVVMRRVRRQLELSCRAFEHVLITGPKGSGREHLARTIHRQTTHGGSSWLLPLDARLLDAELLQTQIVAFVRSCEVGRSESLGAASPPTVLLMEADQLAPDAQLELQGLLSVRENMFRVLATARAGLIGLAEQEAYRPELAYALSTIHIELPPLRERPADIPLLVQYFLEFWNAQGGRQIARFSRDAIDRLVDYPWFGNMDEMAEIVRKARQSCAGDEIQESELPNIIRLAASAAANQPAEWEPIELSQFLADVERKVIERALQRSKWNKAHAARMLGISRPKLLRRIEQLKIDTDQG